MSRTIWKFPLGEVNDLLTLSVPKGAELLTMQVQNGEPCIWALVDPSAPKVTRAFAVRGTGHDASGLEASKHVGSFQLLGGRLVFHVFDLGELP